MLFFSIYMLILTIFYIPSPLKIFWTALLLLLWLSRFKKYLSFLSPFSYQVAFQRIIVPLAKSSYISSYSIWRFSSCSKVYIRIAFATLFFASLKHFFDLRESFSFFTSFFFAIFYAKLSNSVFN